MQCTVLLFAELAERVGERAMTVELDEGATVGTAIAALAARHEAIAAMRGRLAVAVDESYASTSTVLRDRCTIALIPPVSGG